MKNRNSIEKINKVLLLLIGGVVWYINSSQAAVVHDPTNAVHMAGIKSVMDELKELQEQAKSNDSFLKKVMNEGEEVKRLFSLLENIVCATDEFGLYIGVVGDLTLCNRKLNLDMTLSRIDGLSSKIKTIGVGVYTMSQYETIESLKSLNDQLEKSISEMQSINTELKMDVLATLKSASAKSKGPEKVSWMTSANI